MLCYLVAADASAAERGGEVGDGRLHLAYSIA